MKLRKLKLKEFSVVRDAELNFGPQINVLIGRNGAGKSHVLKLLYAILRSARKNEKENDADFGGELKSKLAGVFKPDEAAIGRLVSRGQGRSTAHIELVAGDGAAAHTDSIVDFSISSLSNLKVGRYDSPKFAPSVFLPSREVLAMYEGFVHAYEERELAFDETYRDLCVQLSGGQLRGKRLEVAARLAAPLELALGGAIKLDGGRFYRTGSGGNLEAHLLSEGLRKIGVLTHLILNGSLIQNGFLIWDEPEANLNPRLVTVVARTLRALAHFGIQVFVASHDYLLINELALLDDYADVLEKNEPRIDVKFLGFNLSADGTHATVQSVDHLNQLDQNDIMDEFSAYYDRRSELVERRLNNA